MHRFAQLRSQWRRADTLAVALVLLIAGLRVLFLLTNQLQLSADEMHYWDWSRQLDIAYYSKGPLLALLIRGATALAGDGQLGVRLPAVLLGAIFSLLIYGHSRGRIGSRDALLLTGAVQLIPIIFGLGLAMNSDPPVLVCWTIALMALARATRVDGRGAAAAWVVYGVATAIGITAKYTILLMPVGLVLAAPWQACTRPLLRRPWFWIGQGIALTGLIPLLVWNASHDWVNLAHNAAHLGVGSAGDAEPIELLKGPAELAGSQLLMFGPLTLPLLFTAAFQVVPEAWRRGRPYPLLLGWLAGVLLAICLAVSTRRDVYANWPIPAGITGIFLLIEAWPQLIERLRLPRRLAIASALNAVLACVALLPFYGMRFGLSDRQLPTRKLVGWRELSGALQRQQPQRLAAADLVLTDQYTTAAALAYGLRRPPGEVLTLSLSPRRMNQYDVWAQAAMPRRRGADALIVLSDDADPSGLRDLFGSIESLPDLEIVVNGRPFSRYHVWFGRAYNGAALPRPARR